MSDEAKKPEESRALRDARKKFATFLKSNPKAKISETTRRTGGTQIRIEEPWGDRSVAINIPKDSSNLFSALENVHLPERLTAIWHSDENKLEIIWTAFSPSDTQKEVVGREFEFSFKGKTHKCKFGDSSNRLIEIAKNTVPRGMSSTNHRNMQSFYQFSNANDAARERLGLDTPRSFWISNVKWNESKVLELVNHLNFYMSYFDDMCPTIIIHEPAFESGGNLRRTRYISGAFPATISGSELNSQLLGFWSSTNKEETPVMKFILYYRIIEYASHHYLDDAVRKSIIRILSSPHIRDNVYSAVDEITDIISVKKNDDIPKFKGIVNKCVDKRLIWQEIQANRAFFLKETKFDGGFSIKALINDAENEASFCQRGLDYFCDLLRKIRNALSHGRDQETGGVISPTTKNFALLRPWVHLIGTAAGEVVLYKDAV